MSKMTPEQYQAFKRSLQQTQQKTARMLARIDQTLLGVKDTLNQIQENNDNIEKFQRNYNEVMTLMVQKLAASFVNPFKKVPGKEYEHLPSSPPIKELVSSMLKQEEILLVTGAGVSAASGIPTFRGKGGLYDKLFQWQGQSYSPEEFITHAFYQKHPEAIWRWVEEIYSMAVSCQPNEMHTLIDKLACSLVARGKKVTLVTQNIDDLHLKPSGKTTYQYYAIHGNVKFVRCNAFHLSPYQQFREEIKAERKVHCPQCGGELRPHVLFFDESYGPLYGEEVKGKSFPFVVLMGTSLSTGLCSTFAQKAQLLVEINPEPVVEVGKVFQYSGDSLQVLRGVMKELKETK